MPKTLRAVLIEAVQFIPVLTLAAGFVISGTIDLAVAGPRFSLASLLALPIVIALTVRKIPMNPFLVGADLWLLVGAISFNLPAPPLRDALVALGGGGLFAGALLVGGLYTAGSPRGYLGTQAPSTRPLSLALLTLTAAAAAWAAAHPENIRLGSALPFISINILRRLLGRYAQR